MKKIKLFVYTNNCRNLEAVDVNEDQSIGYLIKSVLPKLANQEDFQEDVEVYLEDHDDDLDKGILFVQAGLENGDHLFVGRCKKVSVSINYAGKYFTIEVSPSASAKKLKIQALKYFGIDDVSGAELLLWHNNEPMDARQLIGSLTDYPSCGVNLILATKNDINGDPSYDLFQNHTNFPEYQSGEIEGRWGIILNKESRPEWPIFFIWIQSSSLDKYSFRFDFSDYPNSAPTAAIWDMDRNCSLDISKRPNNTKRAVQVFKLWGNDCCYLPCDRLAIQGHPNWNQQHSSLIWNSQKDTFIKYLKELYQILNP